MRVVEIETQDQKVRYVVVDEEGNLVIPIVRYLRYLDRIDAARQTLRSYATALRLYWEFLSQEQLDWQRITLDELARFVLWLKLPSGSLKVLPAHPVEQARSNRTINHTLTVVRGFYDYHWRMEDVATNVKDKTTTLLPARARRYKSFLHHITKGSPIEKNILKQSEVKRQRPKTITKDQIQQLLDACLNQRDRLLIRLLYESAIRVGEALSLWVQDVDVAENQLHICDRGPLENGAEIKTIHSSRFVDVSADLIDEIVAYVGIAHTAEVETNHLFVKLHGARTGQALTYVDVDSLFFGGFERRRVFPLLHIFYDTRCSLRLLNKVGHQNFFRNEPDMHPFNRPIRRMCILHKKLCELRGNRHKKLSRSQQRSEKTGNHENIVLSSSTGDRCPRALPLS